MQPMMPVAAESYGSVTRRPLDLEDYVDIVRRHKAWILGPAFGVLVVSVVAAFLWPDTYVSQAVIRVVPPQVPENYVPTNVNVEMSQRINSMAQTILSRGNLTNIINTFSLYPRQRQRKPMEDVVEDMRRDIKIGNVVSLTQGQNRGISAFQISYSYENRIMAQKVTADLVSRFMSENTRDRTTQSVMTTQFLRDQWEQAKKELDAIEDKLTKFRTMNAGRLPDQMQNNYQHLIALETRMANLNGAISRANQDKLLLESDLRSTKAQLSALTPLEIQTTRERESKNERLTALEREVERLELQLSTLKERYRDTYPDVRNTQTMLNVAKKQRDAVLKEEETRKADAAKDKEAAAAPKRVDPMYVRERSNLETAMSRIDAQIQQRNLQIEEYQRDLATTDRQIKSLQSRISDLPVGDQQYQEIIRDRELAKKAYDELSQKRASSQIAEDLEKRQQGETLEVLDPASLPQTPTQPKRPIMIGIGAGAGLLLGLVLAGIREAKDTSLKNLKDARAYTQLTILGSVPLLENDLVVRRRKRLSWLAWSTACLIGIIIMTGSVFYYYATKV